MDQIGKLARPRAKEEPKSIKLRTAAFALHEFPRNVYVVDGINRD
jgi:hypothetical protein